MRAYLVFSLVISCLVFALNLSYRENDQLIEDVNTLKAAEENLKVLPPIISTLCEETKTADKIITKTVYQIKEVPVYEETSTFDLSAELNSLLSETFDSLHLQRAPTGTPH